LPLLSRLAPEFRGHGVDVISIHLGSKEEARDYLREHRISLTALVDEDGSVGQAYGVYGVPKNVLVGADGKILRTSAGMLNENTLRRWMEL
jgi:peroxiredoxin